MEQDDKGTCEHAKPYTPTTCAEEAATPAQPVPVPLGISSHKPTKPPQGMTVTCYKHGIETFRPVVLTAPNKAGPASKRGEITKFSAKSRARLRQVLLKHDPPAGWKPHNITLTVPGPPLTPEAWRDLVGPFWLEVAKQGLASIWRVELTQKGQPHIHALLYGPADCHLAFRQAWWSAIDSLGACRHTVQCKKTSDTVDYSVRTRMNLPGAMGHAVDVQGDNGTSGWWRYLCDHESKKKQAQLGWQGRQWGVVGRKHLGIQEAQGEELTVPQTYLFMRALRRLTRSRVYRGMVGRSVWYTDPVVAKKIIAWAKKEG